MTPRELFDVVYAALEHARDDVELEQASHGIDSWSELELHAVLAAAFVSAGYFVAREQRYPGDRTKKQRTSGRRCDLVVTADGPLLLEGAQPDLFALPSVGASSGAWIEVKVLKQFRAGKANVGWAQSLLTPPTVDVGKLAFDPGLGMRVLLMLLFTASTEVSEHDFGVWRDVVVGRGLPLSSTMLRHLPIVDRRGNRFCTMAFNVVDGPLREDSGS